MHAKSIILSTLLVSLSISASDAQSDKETKRKQGAQSTVVETDWRRGFYTLPKQLQKIICEYGERLRPMTTVTYNLGRPSWSHENGGINATLSDTASYSPTLSSTTLRKHSAKKTLTLLCGLRKNDKMDSYSVVDPVNGSTLPCAASIISTTFIRNDIQPGNRITGNFFAVTTPAGGFKGTLPSTKEHTPTAQFMATSDANVLYVVQWQKNVDFASASSFSYPQIRDFMDIYILDTAHLNPGQEVSAKNWRIAEHLNNKSQQGRITSINQTKNDAGDPIIVLSYATQDQRLDTQEAVQVWGSTSTLELALRNPETREQLMYAPPKSATKALVTKATSTVTTTVSNAASGLVNLFRWKS